MKQVRQIGMPAVVPKAAVVITNPTHFAMALEYERGMDASVRVAKGVDALALKIREVADKHSVPLWKIHHSLAPCMLRSRSINKFRP